MDYRLQYNRILIFDGSHALHRNLSVQNNWDMKTTNGVRTGGIFGTLRTIQKELSTFNYYPIVVFDGHLSERRLKLHPNYKHYLDKTLLTESVDYIPTEEDRLRQEVRDEYIKQRNYLIKLLSYFNIPVIRFDNWEGDDLIYILSKISKDSIVISDDKDLLQLIRNDNTGKCRVRRAMRDEFWDLKLLQENYENVESYVSTKSMLGDSSDNIPGTCTGVGDKSVLDLFKFYRCIKINNIPYPKTEEELTNISKKYNLTKKKAFLNFNENQFLINYNLINLKLVDTEINDSIINSLNSYIKVIYDNLNSKEDQLNKISECLDYLEIRTFDINKLYNRVNDLREILYKENLNIPDINGKEVNL